MLVGREGEPPYDRPPLSKDYLRGESERADAYVKEPSWYEQNGVDLRTGSSVMSLDAEGRVAKLQGGEEVAFGRALLATGAMVNLLRVDGAQLEGIHYLRAFGNADSIRDDVAGAERVVLVGGSYIGAEVAASLTEMGKRCTIVEIEPVILSRSFGADVGRYFHELLESKGIEIAGERDRRRLRGRRAGERRADRVGAGVPLRRRGRRRGRAPGHDARRPGRPRGRGRDRLRLGPRDLGRGDLRRRRLLQLRQRDPRSPAPLRALGPRLPAGPPRRPRDARRQAALPGRPLLLQRPRRLGEPRVRGARRALGRADLARRARERRVLGLVRRRRPRRRRPRRSAAPRTSRTPAG